MTFNLHFIFLTDFLSIRDDWGIGDVKALKLGSREIGILRGDPSMEGGRGGPNRSRLGKIDDFGSRLGKALRLQETLVEP